MYENEAKERGKILTKLICFIYATTDLDKVEKLLNLAYDLGQIIKSNQSLKALATQLGITVERDYLTALSQSCPPWQRVFLILSLWEKKEEATKEKLKGALKRLGHPTSILD